MDLADLDKRGEFELVTVQIPLGKRDATAVIAEITPIKGVHGQIVSLPTTGPTADHGHFTKREDDVGVDRGNSRTEAAGSGARSDASTTARIGGLSNHKG